MPQEQLKQQTKEKEHSETRYPLSNVKGLLHQAGRSGHVRVARRKDIYPLTL